MKSISISERAIHTPASAIRKLVPMAEAAKKRGRYVYHVNIGQPDLPTPPEILSELRQFSGTTLEYAPSSGIKKVIEAWQTFYRQKDQVYNTEDILVTSGGSEGLIFAFFTVADPGQELIVFEPFYTSYAIVASMGNIILKPVLTKAEDGFHLPAKEVVERAITRKTKGIILCNPNNPTGTLYTEKEVEMIVEIARRHNLFIISDETYQELVYDGKKVLPFVSFPEIHNQLIVVDSVSKRFNSCGARIGCVVSKNKDIMGAILRFAQSRLSVATVDQLAVVPLLTHGAPYIESMKQIYTGRRNTVVEGLKKIKGVDFVTPSGAFYIIPKLPIRDSDDFASFLLTDFEDKKETVMVAPATGFYKTNRLGHNEIRIAYVLEEQKLKRAIELLGIALMRYQKGK